MRTQKPSANIVLVFEHFNPLLEAEVSFKKTLIWSQLTQSHGKLVGLLVTNLNLGH
jgi:hypothetical protein